MSSMYGHSPSQRKYLQLRKGLTANLHKSLWAFLPLTLIVPILCLAPFSGAAETPAPGNVFSNLATPTTTTVTSNANPSVFGQPVTFTATVSTAGLGTPTGSVQFFDGGNPIGGPVALNGSGQAQVTTSTLSVGNHTISASYSGSAGFDPSSGNLTGNPQVVNKANTTTAINTNQPNPVGTGVAVTFTATVSPTAPGAGTRTGTVTFFRNGVAVCSNVTINASGQATCNITFTLAGNYNITAQYSGSANFNASSTAAPFVQQVVGPTAGEVTLIGRVLSANGRGLKGAMVTIAGGDLAEPKTAVANAFGHFRLSGVTAGHSYIVTVSSKRARFAQPSRVVQVNDDVAGLDFVAEP